MPSSFMIWYQLFLFPKHYYKYLQNLVPTYKTNISENLKF